MALKSRHNAALFILTVGAFRHYGYLLASPEHIGALSKALGGLALLALVPVIYQWAPSKAMALVLAWWCFESLQTAICSFAYMYEPWSVAPGKSICSEKIGFDLGALGVMFVGFLLWHLVPLSSDRLQKESEKS